jgi:hypothetical protein
MKRVIVLRHDVDYALDGLLDLALMEKKAGATATYLLRVHAKEYNPFNYITYKTIKEIIALGHEIGLHFECTIFETMGWDNAKAIFLKEKMILESIYGIPIETAAQHKGMASLSKDDYMFFDKYDKSDVGLKRYVHQEPFKSMKYLSDSNSVWRDGCLCKNLGKYDRMQVLIHADWWFKDHYCIKPVAPWC